MQQEEKTQLVNKIQSAMDILIHAKDECVEKAKKLNGEDIKLSSEYLLIGDRLCNLALELSKAELLVLSVEKELVNFLKGE